MILRRVIEHFRKQEWTAIALDFCIVVAGILIAFQITSWNERRTERARAISYLERLDDDLATDISNYDRRGLAFWKVVSGYGYDAENFASKGDMGGKTYWQLLVAFFQASQADVISITHPTYDEMTSAGELGLISDVSLRKTLSIYYGNTFYQALSESPAYRAHVRGVIPAAIQAYIWDNCFASDPYRGQSMIGCDSPISEQRAKQIVEAIASDEAMMAELRYWLSTMHVATIIANDRINAAQDLRNAIAANLGRARSKPENESAKAIK